MSSSLSLSLCSRSPGRTFASSKEEEEKERDGAGKTSDNHSLTPTLLGQGEDWHSGSWGGSWDPFICCWFGLNTAPCYTKGYFFFLFSYRESYNLAQYFKRQSIFFATFLETVILLRFIFGRQLFTCATFLETGTLFHNIFRDSCLFAKHFRDSYFLTQYF